MSDQAPRWQSLRTVLEAVIVALLLWTGRSLVTLQTQIAVVQADIQGLRGQLSDVPRLTSTVAELKVQVERDRADIAELRAVRNLR